MYRVSKLIASTHAEFLWSNNVRSVAVDFLDRLPAGDNLSLHFEDLRGDQALPVIAIYLNLENPENPTVQNYVGAMALYGITTASQHRVFEAGRIFRHVKRLPNWSEEQFILTLFSDRTQSRDATLHIGRVTLYFNES